MKIAINGFGRTFFSCGKRIGIKRIALLLMLGLFTLIPSRTFAICFISSAKELYNGSDYIFTGTVISNKIQHNEGKFSSTVYNFEIKDVIKGRLNKNAEIVVPGGFTDHPEFYQNRDYAIFASDKDGQLNTTCESISANDERLTQIKKYGWWYSLSRFPILLMAGGGALLGLAIFLIIRRKLKAN